MKIKSELGAKVAQWSNDRQSIIDNAFVYACMHNHIEAARLLLQKGAQINAIAAGFDFSGTGLHYAAVNGHRAMAEFLIEQSSMLTGFIEKIGVFIAGMMALGALFASPAALAADIQDFFRPLRSAVSN